ncbi:MAG TPA: nucleotidyl transferase AbiEii/AbiGii toxin family protein [Verrucomicrobiae bacterium]|nr:nucleotidyl transferase AbiEii/AbiGii toxin family protein [Verrucomicrobiae bacterium]
MPEPSGNHVLEILRVLAAQKVDFIICGGVAAVLHGVERMTLDVDLSVAMNRENLEKLIRAVRELGLTPRAPVAPEVLLDPEQVQALIKEKHALAFTFLDPDRPYRQVDILLTPDASYEMLKGDAVTMNAAEVRVPVASIERLIAMKKKVRPKREKDAADVRALKTLMKS